VYRYSLLNQNEAQDYDNEFENALTTKAVVYQDSSDDEVGFVIFEHLTLWHKISFLQEFNHTLS